MKKSVKPDVVELISKLQEEIAIIGRKIDTLISKSSPRPVEVKPFQQPVQNHNHNHNNQGNRRQDNGFRERVLYKAVCADCRKECEVPFKPSGERPVYCKECFSKRKTIVPSNVRPDNRPKVTVPVQTVQVSEPEVVEKKKPAAKKKQALKKKKK